MKSIMYPKVKVRQEEEEEEELHMKNFQSLSLYNHHHHHHHHPSNSNSNSNSPEHKDKDGYTYTPLLVKSHISTTSGSDAGNLNNTKVNTNKPNSLLLRPRAVLSSPENDAILGTKNKTKTDHSSSKNYNSRQNRHVKCNKSYQLEKKKKIRSTSWEQ